MAKDYDLKHFKAIENVKITGLGTSQASEEGETFNYLEFKDADGNIERIDIKTLIPNSMCMNFAAGSIGDFYFGFTNRGHWVLIASKVGDEKRTFSSYRISTLMGSAGCASVAFGIIFFYVAIPLYAYLRIKRNADARRIFSFLADKRDFKELSVS